MNKFIIYKGSGGLAHMLKGLSYAIYLSKNEKRFLIIDCKNNSPFRHYFKDFFYIDNSEFKYSEDYKDIPKNYKFYKYNLFDIENKNKLINVRKGSYYFGNYNISHNKYLKKSKNNIIMYYGCVAASLQINSNIKVHNKINDIIKNKYIDIDKKYISVHFRNTDYKNDIKIFISKIKESSEKYDIKDIYLATDDSKAFDIIREELKELNIIQYTKPIGNCKNIHYGDPDKYKIIMNVLTDIYFILKSTYFIPSTNSGLSQWIIHMLKDKNNLFNIKSNCKVI